MTKKKHVSSIQRRLIPTYIFLIIVSFLSVFPFYWMVTAATNTSVEVARGKITFGTHALENFQHLIAAQDLWERHRVVPLLRAYRILRSANVLHKSTKKILFRNSTI